MNNNILNSAVANDNNSVVSLVLSNPKNDDEHVYHNDVGGGTLVSDDVWKTKESSNTITLVTTNGGHPLSKPVKIRLPWNQRICYSVGHVYNDLCASMWFTYMLMYFTLVLEFSSSSAGILVLVGQVADAVATPFVGLASDKQHSMKICRYGRRKIWHLIGTVCVTISFPFLFIPCLGCEHTVHSMQMIYYGSFIILFQFGWASVQVAHLSLIPDLSKSPNERTELSAYRNAFTVISSICVYGITWAVLGTTGDSSSIGPADKEHFRDIALIVTGIGIVFAIIFHVGVREPSPPPKLKKIVKAIVNNQQDKQQKELNGHPVIDVTELPDGHTVELNGPKSMEPLPMTWKMWLKVTEFYKVAVMYMCTRLFVNISQTYITLYLQDSLKLSKDSVAIIPLVVYVCGFFASLCMKMLNKRAGRMISYVIGAVVGLGFCVWIFFGQQDSYDYLHYEIYGAASLMGIGGSVVLVTCLSITADLIGNNVQSGAFVYGAMSFADKLSNGIVVVIVQYLNNDKFQFYKNVLTFGCGGPQLVALITLFTINKTLLNTNRQKSDDYTAEGLNGAVLSPVNGAVISSVNDSNDEIKANEADDEIKRF